MKIRDWNDTETSAAFVSPPSEPVEALSPHRIVELYADDVWRYASSKLRRKEDAEDVAMEVFASAMREFPRLLKADSPRLWLLALARNKVNDALRRSYRRRESPLSDALAVTHDRTIPRESLIEALDDLPDLHREVLVLKYVSGLSTEEVAQVIRKSAAATNSLLQRARQSLREIAHPLIEAQGGMA